MFCYKCGTQLADGTLFCANCGAPQQAAQQTTGQPVQQTEQPYVYPEPIKQSTEPAYSSPEPITQATDQNYPAQEQPYSLPDLSYPPPEQAYPAPGSIYAAQPGAPAQQAQTSEQYNAVDNAPTRKKGLSWWKIAVPIVVVVIAAVAVYYFVFLRSTSNVFNNALANTSEELAQRFGSTPLKVFGLLSETLKDGTVTVSFDYEDSWYGDETSGSVSISSVLEAREFAFAGDIKIYDGYWESEQNIPFEVFVNKERMAFGSKLIGDEYYGFRYSTFRDDIKYFGAIASLNNDLTDQLADIVEMLEELLNKKDTDKGSVSSDAYTAIITNFVKSCELTSERVEVDSGGATVRATKVNIEITKDAILKLLNELYDQLDKDEDMREYFDMLYTNYSMFLLGADYNSMLRELSNLIDEFDDYYSGTIMLAFYIGNGDRLLRYEVDLNARFDSERIRGSFSLDFGASVTDRWVLRVDANGETVRVNWDYKERSNSIENTITFTVQDSETITLMSVYSPTKGDFTLSYESESRYGGSDYGEISGVLTEDSRGFRLSLDNLMDPDNDEVLTIEIKGETGANIRQVEYISLDKWELALIDKLEDAFS